MVSDLDLKLQLAQGHTHCSLPLPWGWSWSPANNLPPSGSTTWVRGRTGAHQPAWGPTVSPTPRAPECPFSGLSVTMPMSCPTLALGLTFGSSVTPPYPQSWGQTQGYPKTLPSPTPRAATCVCPPSGKRPQLGLPKGQPGMAREGLLGARQLWPTAPGQPAGGRESAAGSLAVNYYAIPVPIFYVHAQPCWSGGQQRGRWATAWSSPGLLRCLGQGLGKPLASESVVGIVCRL